MSYLDHFEDEEPPEVDELWEPIFLHGGRSMMVHGSSRCLGDNCVIHKPSEHALNTAPLNWRGDIGLMERICEHGIGHPDPDDIAYKVLVADGPEGEADAWAFGIHGCDGCCSSTKEG